MTAHQREKIVRGFARILGLKIHSFYNHDYRYSKWAKKYGIPEDVMDSLDFEDERFEEAMMNDTEDFSKYLQDKIVNNIFKTEALVGRFGLGEYFARIDLIGAAAALSSPEQAQNLRCHRMCMRWEWEKHNEEFVKEIHKQLLMADNSWQEQELWPRYISTLVELDHKDEAKTELYRYIDKCGKNRIHEFALVSELSAETGIINEKIQKSAIISKVIKNNEGLLSKYLEGKSVAVVGNAPNELKKGRGKEIDSHDVVVRFNDYQIEGFENDYGTKTTVLVKNGDTKKGLYVLTKEELKSIDIVLMEIDVRHFGIQESVLDIFSYYAETCPDKLCRLDYRPELIEEIAIFPTSGALLLYNLFRRKKKCQFNVDYYGFSFLDKTNEKTLTDYYRSKDESTTNNMHHNMQIENEYLRKIAGVN